MDKHTQFDDALRNALSAVSAHYMKVPIDGGPSVVRERAFAYELYHQLRGTTGKIAYTLTGELSKVNHPVLKAAGQRSLCPDLLLHTPGNKSGNFVAIEIKGGRVAPRALRKDLASLTFMKRFFGYERLIYIVYGIGKKEVARIQRLAISATHDVNGRPIDVEGIELWVHSAADRTPSVFRWSA